MTSDGGEVDIEGISQFLSQRAGAVLLGCNEVVQVTADHHGRAGSPIPCHAHLGPGGEKAKGEDYEETVGQVNPHHLQRLQAGFKAVTVEVDGIEEEV